MEGESPLLGRGESKKTCRIAEGGIIPIKPQKRISTQQKGKARIEVESLYILRREIVI